MRSEDTVFAPEKWQREHSLLLFLLYLYISMVMEKIKQSSNFTQSNRSPEGRE